MTITGGKTTTFRLMAEAAVDAACEQLGVDRPSRTAMAGAAQPPFRLDWITGR